MQGRYATCQNAEFQALDVVTEKVGLEFKHDFVILKVQDFSPEAKLRHMSNILILDELFTTITADLLPRQLSDLQDLVNKECNILWVTSGAQMNITNPDRAATTGFLRTLRMEEVHLRIIALDVETSTGPETIPAIETCLRLLVNPEGRFRRESEFAERSAVIHTPRLIVDEELEEAKYEHMKERASEMKDLQGEICLQLETRYESSRASYVEVELASVLQNTHIEVEVFAASVPPAKGQSATTTVGYGLAGIVAKVGNNVLGLSIGQRVVLLHDAVANRVQVPAFCAQSIPDSMPFESAASVPAAWFTSLHALTILADLQRGQRLLIHSTGDVNDLAAVVIAQRKGAEVFVSAPSPEAQRFFQETVALSPERILLNGEKAFKDTILRLTKDEGVNVAFGSFKDDSLGLAWDTIAAGGTLVTVGCTGSPGEAYLPMEPFARGASIKVLDPTKLRTDPNCTGRLFKEAFELMEDDVSQSTTLLSISDFKDANTVPRRKCSSENDVIVLSRAPGEPAMVPVHPRPRTLKFKDNACYLLIGGLKGLCGSIAIDFAMRGAKHLAVMSRSGHDDEASRMVVRQIESLGCHIDLLRGDITNLEDVRRVFTETALSVAGIIQGSMVLRDRPFPVMTIDEYHEAASCKITGTWNLHNVAQELNLTLDFFTLLSSISSVLGGMAQANYAAGCAFLDAFAAYRRSLGLPAFSVNLGIIGDVGYMARDEALLERHIGSVTTSIEEDLMRQILRYTIMQQSDEPVSCAATTNIVTGIAVPQSGDSYLRLDNRFSHLFVGGAETGTAEDNGSKDSAQHMKDLKIMLGCETKAFDRLAAMEALTAVINAIFVDDVKDFPEHAQTVFQFCDGWELNENFAALNAAAKGLINAYPNSDALARKDYMARVIECWTAKRPDSILKTNSPATVRLSLDYAEYVDDALAAADDLTLLYSLEDNLHKDPSEREWWILKPALVDCGAGIRIFSTEEELASNLELAEYEDDGDDEDSGSEKADALTEAEGANPKDFAPTLSVPGLSALDALVTTTTSLSLEVSRAPKQQYVFKADGRIPSAQMREFVAQRYIVSIPPLEKRKWHARAYVLSVGRLKVHVFKEMLALLAGEDYAPPWENPSLRASLTNTGLQDADDIISKESMRDLWAAPDDLLPGDWKNNLFNQVCEVSSELFRGAVHTMADKFTTMDKCFELFALDFLVDTDGLAWLLEVNETPAFYEEGIAGPIALRLMESVIGVTMEHMGFVKADDAMSMEAKSRMVQVLDETDSLAKSNITQILPE
ncbi:hypothetical protein ACHAQA_008442 [Verticillium albo-atrum]